MRNIRIINTPAAADRGKDDVGFGIGLRRRYFRSLVDCFVVPCGRFFFHPYTTTTTTGSATDIDSDDVVIGGGHRSVDHRFLAPSAYCHHRPLAGAPTAATVVTGTFFGRRQGCVSFCLQEDPNSTPLLLLEFAVPTAYLAREMRHGLLRIALTAGSSAGGRGGLFGVSVWSMYCNGRKVGFAVKREASKADAAVLGLMRIVSVGAGMLVLQHAGAAPLSRCSDGSGGQRGGGGGAGEEATIMYMRASFEKVVGSPDSESFHMINPLGSPGQELSIFFLKS